MNTIEKIRRKKLAQLVSDSGGVGLLATKVGKSSAQISQWLNASPDSKTGKPRGMRAESCRQLEDICGMPSGWMDQDDSDRSIGHATETSSGQHFYSKVPLSPSAARLIREIISAEEHSSSSPKIIEALTKVLHVAIPTATNIAEQQRISRLIDDD